MLCCEGLELPQLADQNMIWDRWLSLASGVYPIMDGDDGNDGTSEEYMLDLDNVGGGSGASLSAAEAYDDPAAATRTSRNHTEEEWMELSAAATLMTTEIEFLRARVGDFESERVKRETDAAATIAALKAELVGITTTVDNN